MRVDGFHVTMHSSWEKTTSCQVEERLDFTWVPAGGGKDSIFEKKDEVVLSPEVKSKKCDKEMESEIEDAGDFKIRLIKLLVEAFTGRKIRMVRWTKKEGEVDFPAADKAKTEESMTAPRPNWGLSYERRESWEEMEAVSFQGRGVVRTDDGRLLSFSVEMNLKRSFSYHASFSLRLGQAAQDPLVLSLDGGPLGLGDGTMDLALDGDGILENLPSLRPGSAFLVWDKNRNGRVDGGLELFGPGTGDGFYELSLLDEDGNGWIDEGDGVWGELGLLVREEGEELFFSLERMGIGAIFTGRITTPFSYLNTSSGQKLGELRASGIYLTEQGQARVVGQIDLTSTGKKVNLRW